MKLIKLNTDHYVIVDDSEIKVGDWIVNINGYWKGKIAQSTGEVMDCWKKITHSTQPFNCNCSNKGYRLDTNCAERNHCFDKIQYLSLQEVKEILGEVNVEKKVKNEMGIPDYLPTNSMSPSMQGSLEFGIKCYTQALEDNKDKKYTEEDLKKAIEFGYQLRCNNRPINSGHNWVKDFIAQSLQPKTEWEVEFIDGKLKLKQ